MITVKIKHTNRKEIISAAYVEILDGGADGRGYITPRQVYVVDVRGRETVVDCTDKSFIHLSVDGEIECRNPNIKRR